MPQRSTLPANWDVPQEFRDRAYQIDRTAELLYGQARNALDFAMAQRAEEQLILGGMLTLFVTQPAPRRPGGSRTSDRGRKTPPDSNRRFGGR